MKNIIEQIIKYNTPEKAAEKIFKLKLKSDISIDNLSKAFQGGRDSVEAEIGYEHFGDMEAYPKKKIVKSFKQWMHEFKKTKGKGN